MMHIEKIKEGGRLTVALKGRMDAGSAPQLDELLKSEIDSVTDLTIDLEKLVYTSSAGLRVLLGAQKAMNKRGSMAIRNVRRDIMEIFDMTGFSKLLNIED